MLPASSPQLVEVRLDGLQLSPTNPRKQFDATRHAELTASIQAQGILVPLLCRPLPSQQLEVVAGAPGAGLWEALLALGPQVRCTTDKCDEPYGRVHNTFLAIGEKRR